MTIAAFAPSNALARPSSTSSTPASVPSAARGGAFGAPIGVSSRLHQVLAAESNGNTEGDKGDKPSRPLIRIPVEKIQSLREHVLDAWGPKLEEIQEKIGELQDEVDDKRHDVEQEIGKWDGAVRESGDRAMHALDPVKDIADQSIDRVKAHLPKSSDLADNSAKNLAEGKFGKAYGAFLGAAGARVLEGALKNLGSKTDVAPTPPADESASNAPEAAPEDASQLPADDASTTTGK